MCYAYNNLKIILKNNPDITVYETSGDITYLSDEFISAFFDRFNKQYKNKDFIYGIEFPIRTGDETELFYDVNGIDQYKPWRSEGMMSTDKTYSVDENGFFKKLLDNEGKKATFNEFGENKKDDYEDLSFFKDWKCWFVIDSNGFKRPTCIEGVCPALIDGIEYDYNDCGKRIVNEEVIQDQNVGIITQAFWIKDVNEYNTDDYPEELYPIYYDYNVSLGEEPILGYPVKRIYVSLNNQNDSQWKYYPAAVRCDNVASPYIVRCPYIAGIKDKKLFAQKGLETTQELSPLSLTAYINGGTSSEYYVWVLLNMLLKYGTKASKNLALGSLTLSSINSASKTVLPDELELVEDTLYFTSDALSKGDIVSISSNSYTNSTFISNTLSGLPMSCVIVSDKVEEIADDVTYYGYKFLQLVDDEFKEVKIEGGFLAETNSYYKINNATNITSGICDIIPDGKDGVTSNKESARSMFRIRGMEFGLNGYECFSNIFATLINWNGNEELKFIQFAKGLTTLEEKSKLSLKYSTISEVSTVCALSNLPYNELNYSLYPIDYNINFVPNISGYKDDICYVEPFISPIKSDLLGANSINYGTDFIYNTQSINNLRGVYSGFISEYENGLTYMNVSNSVNMNSYSRL